MEVLPQVEPQAHADRVWAVVCRITRSPVFGDRRSTAGSARVFCRWDSPHLTDAYWCNERSGYACVASLPCVPRLILPRSALGPGTSPPWVSR